MPEDTKALMEGALDDHSFLEQCYQTLEVQRKILFEQIKSFDKGVFAFVFDTTDRVQHMFWKTLKGKDLDNTDKNNPILQVYKYMDGLLGNLFHYISDNTVFLLSSDHGFSDYDYSVHMNNFLVDKGFMALKEDYTKGDLVGLFKAVDWGRTKAYAVGFNSVYLNQKGRERYDIVKETERDKLMEELIAP